MKQKQNTTNRNRMLKDFSMLSSFILKNEIKYKSEDKTYKMS